MTVDEHLMNNKTEATINEKNKTNNAVSSMSGEVRDTDPLWTTDKWRLNKTMNASTEKELKTNEDTFWEEAVIYQKEINKSMEMIKQENLTLYAPQEHNHIEKRSVGVHQPVHVDRFEERENLLDTKNPSAMASMPL